MLTVFAIAGIGEIVDGDDLATIIGDALDAAGADAGAGAGAAAGAAGAAGDAGSIGSAGALQDGDILAVTSKIVSKAEGRMILAADREQAITDETVRLVASRAHPGGVTRIVENRLGIVAAAAGVDASNTPEGTVLLLPVDPDASAARLRLALQERFGVNLGIVITDTLGRAWREGQTDAAIGGSGVRLIDDLRGTHDTQGRVLDVTAPAVGDEIAAAADLVKRKSTGLPVAVVRGLGHLLDADAPGARILNRNGATDMFRLGTAEAWQEGYEAGLAASGAAGGTST
jgi:coenzyme F420-0:L-glutamate ligase/coenzyme F420-1:gamma-L-glutamate ligase